MKKLILGTILGAILLSGVSAFAKSGTKDVGTGVVYGTLNKRTTNTFRATSEYYNNAGGNDKSYVYLQATSGSSILRAEQSIGKGGGTKANPDIVKKEFTQAGTSLWTSSHRSLNTPYYLPLQLSN